MAKLTFLFLVFSVFFYFTGYTAEIRYGDLNADGSVTAEDQSLLMDFISGKASPSPAQHSCADLNADGKIDAKDAFLINLAVSGTGDFDGNGHVDQSDHSILQAGINNPYDEAFDINKDSVLDARDLSSHKMLVSLTQNSMLGKTVTVEETAESQDTETGSREMLRGVQFNSGIIGDVDKNGTIDQNDYVLLSSFLGTKPYQKIYDINKDGKFDWSDIKVMKSIVQQVAASGKIPAKLLPPAPVPKVQPPKFNVNTQTSTSSKTSSGNTSTNTATSNTSTAAQPPKFNVNTQTPASTKTSTGNAAPNTATSNTSTPPPKFNVNTQTSTSSKTSTGNTTASTTASSQKPQGVVSFSLIDADTDLPVSGYDPIPQQCTINLSKLSAKNIDIRANTKPSVVGSVEFNMNSIGFAVENQAPYAFGGDNAGDYYGFKFPEGLITLQGDAYNGSNKSGGKINSHILTFTITSGKSQTNQNTPNTASGSTTTGGTGGSVNPGTSTSSTPFPSNLQGIKWLHTDVSGWRVSSKLSRVSVSGSSITLDYDKASVWPGINHVGAFVNANPWIFAEMNGTWYAATWEWMRHGQTTKNKSSVAGDHIKKSPFPTSWKPTPGVTYYFMVSGLARDSKRNVQERTNIVKVVWPGAQGSTTSQSSVSNPGKTSTGGNSNTGSTSSTPVNSPAGSTPFPKDFRGVKWLHTDVSGWKESSKLSSVNVSGSNITLNYDKASTWPGINHVGAFVNANPWIFAEMNGTWYAATWEWMRHGQTTKNKSSVAGDHIKKSPFPSDWKPTSGVTYYFMVSGLARDSTRNVQERTNVVKVVWP